MLARLQLRVCDFERQALLPSEHGLVLCAVILEDAADVFQQREAEDHDQEERHADHAVNQIKADRRAHWMQVVTRARPSASVPSRLFGRLIRRVRCCLRSRARTVRCCACLCAACSRHRPTSGDEQRVC